jgi:hypothetical protein
MEEATEITVPVPDIKPDVAAGQVCAEPAMHDHPSAARLRGMVSCPNVWCRRGVRPHNIQKHSSAHASATRHPHHAGDGVVLASSTRCRKEGSSCDWIQGIGRAQ